MCMYRVISLSTLLSVAIPFTSVVMTPRWSSLIFLASVLISSLTFVSPTLSTASIRRLREETREAFFHSYDSYLTFAYPHDELKPLSCEPRSYLNKTRGTLDDVLGGFMLTLIDSLDTLLLMREFQRFNEALVMIHRDLSFDKDVSVSVFETNIRVLGGLLSAHQLSLTLGHAHNITYDGSFLLHKAVDLADRLLPAFDTKTGIPYHVVHLQHGVQTEGATAGGTTTGTRGTSSQTCPAAGASFLLEFGLLSRLTGNKTYADKAHKATLAIWTRRSKLNLVGSLIDVQTGRWLQAHTGIGAGIDSFYETMFKGHMLLGDQYLDMHEAFADAYAATQRHLLVEGWHVEVDMHKGTDKVFSHYFSAVAAFWPGLQVLAGHVKDGDRAFHRMAHLWYTHKALPDVYDLQRGGALSYAQDYPLRPEMIESVFQLFKATGKNKYLKFGEDFLLSLQTANRAKCGYAASRNVAVSAAQFYHRTEGKGPQHRWKKQRQLKHPLPVDIGGGFRTKYTSSYKRAKLQDDRMDSYFLSETLKYLFLLFDEALPVEERSSFFCHHPSYSPQSSPTSSKMHQKINGSQKSESQSSAAPPLTSTSDQICALVEPQERIRSPSSSTSFFPPVSFFPSSLISQQSSGVEEISSSLPPPSDVKNNSSTFSGISTEEEHGATDQKRAVCIDHREVVFSTEGHVFLTSTHI